ncbi:hypothetical protein EDC65_5240 [Stella humosa]|uniref:DUF4412 domain-containing protein n=1 Tax=Stella humosa TaxID=94 RepID=A0A3N1KPY6_9PROT|nr:hypothetical protein [Stella humosa]ROP81382.1 hypothetical protein EDC65_5240 [Stella humosa]BBK32733.1 hypothetical protein STHU_33670 [Stella humosa]
MRFPTLVALALLSFVPAATAAEFGPFGFPTTPYSADSRVTADGQTMTARIHADGPRERREVKDGEMAHTMLIDHAGKKAMMLLVEDKTAMEVDMGDEAGPDAMKWTTQVVGPEQVGGLATTKHHIDGKAANGDRVVGHVWLTADKIPVKSELDATEDGQTARVVQELTNLKVGPVDPALFAVPAGYKRMQMPAGGGPASPPVMRQ